MTQVGKLTGTEAVPDEVQISAREELYEIAEVLREADSTEKQAKKLKDEVRGPFIQLISEVVREEVPLAREVVTVPLEEVMRFEHPEAWVAFNHPGWRLVGLSTEDGHDYVVTIEENEDFKKFEFVVNGFKYGRTVRMKNKSFDAEAFAKFVKETDEVDDTLRAAMLDTVAAKIVTVYDFDEAKAVELMADKPETVAVFQRFINPGTPEISLLPIKAVKEQPEE